MCLKGFRLMTLINLIVKELINNEYLAKKTGKLNDAIKFEILLHVYCSK